MKYLLTWLLICVILVIILGIIDPLVMLWLFEALQSFFRSIMKEFINVLIQIVFYIRDLI